MFCALLESADGVEAQPTIADAAVIKNVPPRIRTAFRFSAIGIPNLGIRIHSTTLYAIEPLEAKPEHARWESHLDPSLTSRDRPRIGIYARDRSDQLPEKISTTSYIAGSNFAMASACCKYGNGAGFSRIAW